MAETPELRRARILAAAPETHAWEYDLALDLGYEPESWDGMWKLAIHPFTVRGDYIIARECPSAFKRRFKAHPIPDGWSIIEDHRLTESAPRMHIVKMPWYKVSEITGLDQPAKTGTA